MSGVRPASQRGKSLPTPTLSIGVSMKYFLRFTLSSLLIASLILVVSSPAWAQAPKPSEPLPKIGAKVQFDKNSFGKVIGAGSKPFSYKATGESIIIMLWPSKQNVMVLVADSGTDVHFDPAQAKLDYQSEGKQKKKDLHAKGTWVVLEYLR